MPARIEDYALIGNCETAALVARDGSIDWLCLPRFDSPACFAGLLGTADHGRWQIAPTDPAQVSRSYRPGTLVLDTVFSTASGSVAVTDCMIRRAGATDVVRLVTGRSGRTAMTMELVIRYDYGLLVPWVTRIEDGRLTAVGGPDRLTLATAAPIRGEDMRTRADFTVASGETVAFVLTWSPSHLAAPTPIDAGATVEAAVAEWREWSDRYPVDHPWAAAAQRSLITLKALTHHETGGIVAAPTTSLPEAPGGSRNWDYRYCWLRDATFTLYALMDAGFTDEALMWREWLLRSVAGDPAQMQVLYGVAGERRLTEIELPWLPGYEGAKPVRIGNAAAGQLQLDVIGELLDALHQGRRHGIPPAPAAWNLECKLLEHLEGIWTEPDRGIWEMRGTARRFTHSHVMAWVAFDRAVRGIEEFGLEGPLERWRTTRREIHQTVCQQGFNAEIGAFVQSFGSTELDASALLLPLVGFLPPDDPRIVGTVDAIERTLLVDGLVKRYETASADDGLPSGEGMFLACSFWLVDNYTLMGRIEDAERLFERLLSLCNEVGLLAEEYDPANHRQLGNFPQAFSHVALINSAHNLLRRRGPAQKRAEPAAVPAQ